MRKSKFTVVFRGEDSYILHNTMKNTVMRVSDGEYTQFIDEMEETNSIESDFSKDFPKALLDYGFVVEDDENEMATLNSRFFDFERDSELCITMIVTRNCNFRCPYCYEIAEPKSMDQKIYHDTKTLIINQIKGRHFKNVYLSFFGGEPTLEAEHIITFLKELKEENEKLPEPAIIQAGMTTNAYLLTPDVVDRLLQAGVEHYQITIDGRKETHDKSRILLDGSGTWDKIIKQVQYFKTKKENFSILLRSNISPEIYNDIDNWLGFLAENFNDDERFKIHFETAKNFGIMKDKEFELCGDETGVLLDVIQKSKKLSLKLELLSFNMQPFAMVCYAARQNAWLVDYDGKLKKCTSSMLDDSTNEIGDLEHGISEKGYKKSAKWTSYELPERCRECEILPICYGRKCPVGVAAGEQCHMLKSLYYAGIDYFYVNKDEK